MRLPIRTVLDRVEPVTDLDGSRGVIFDEDTEEHLELDVPGAVRELRANKHSWSFARLELPDVTLVWEQAQSADERDHGPLTDERYELAERGEFGLLASVFDAAVWVRLVEDTATAAVSEQAAQLIEQVGVAVENLGHDVARAPG